MIIFGSTTNKLSRGKPLMWNFWDSLRELLIQKMEFFVEFSEFVGPILTSDFPLTNYTLFIIRQHIQS